MADTISQEFREKKRAQDRKKTEEELNDLAENGKRLTLTIRKLSDNLKEGITQGGVQSVRSGIVRGGVTGASRTSQAVLGGGALAATNNVLLSGLIVGAVGAIEKGLTKTFDFFGDVSSKKEEKKLREKAEEEIRMRLNLTEEEFDLLKERKKAEESKQERDREFQSFLQDKLGIQSDLITDFIEAQDKGDTLRDESGRFTSIRKALNLPTDEEQLEAERKKIREDGITAQKVKEPKKKKGSIANLIPDLGILASPLLLGLVTGIVGIVTALAFTSSEELSELGSKFNRTVVPMLKGLFDFSFNTVAPEIIRLLSGTLDNLEDAKNNIADTIGNDDLSFFEKYLEINKAVNEATVGLLDGIATGIANILGADIGVDDSAFGRVRDAITSVMDTLAERIRNLIPESIRGFLGIEEDTITPEEIQTRRSDVETKISNLQREKSRLSSGPGGEYVNADKIEAVNEKIKEAKVERDTVILDETKVLNRKLQIETSKDAPDVEKIEGIESRLEVLKSFRIDPSLRSSLLKTPATDGAGLKRDSESIKSSTQTNLGVNNTNNITSSSTAVRGGDMFNVSPSSGSGESTFNRLSFPF